MTKHDTPKGDQPKTDSTRRDILTLSAAVAAFGVAMGMTAANAFTKVLDKTTPLNSKNAEHTTKQQAPKLPNNQQNNKADIRIWLKDQRK